VNVRWTRELAEVMRPFTTGSDYVNQIRLEPVTSANVVTYSTIVTAPNEDLKLRPGMTANIFIFTKEIDSTMLITAKALKYKPDEALGKQYAIFPDTVSEREVAREEKRATANPQGNLEPAAVDHDFCSCECVRLPGGQAKSRGLKIIRPCSD